MRQGRETEVKVGATCVTCAALLRQMLDSSGPARSGSGLAGGNRTGNWSQDGIRGERMEGLRRLPTRVADQPPGPGDRRRRRRTGTWPPPPVNQPDRISDHAPDVSSRRGRGWKARLDAKACFVKGWCRSVLAGVEAEAGASRFDAAVREPGGGRRVEIIEILGQVLRLQCDESVPVRQRFYFLSCCGGHALNHHGERIWRQESEVEQMCTVCGCGQADVYRGPGAGTKLMSTAMTIAPSPRQRYP